MTNVSIGTLKPKLNSTVGVQSDVGRHLDASMGSQLNKKAQLWLRNPRDATAFQIHPEEIHRNDDDDDDDFSFTSRRNEHSVRLLRSHTA